MGKKSLRDNRNKLTVEMEKCNQIEDDKKSVKSRREWDS